MKSSNTTKRVQPGNYRVFSWLKRWWRQRRQKTKLILAVIVLALVLRFLPYLAPISAEDLRQTSQAVEFRDRQGLLLGTLLSRDLEHTVAVPLEEISPHFINAILAAEDGDFYHHGPLEMKAIARSLMQAARSRRIVSGASTITMQLARMVEPDRRTLSAKVKEVWLSWRLAAGMNKDEILQAYINRLPMGGNIYGVEAASRIYFGIPAADLNLAQASLLAGIPNNPTYLNPYEYWQPLKKRQQYVLDRLVKEGEITQTQADGIYREAIALQPRQQGILAAPHFLFWLADRLPAQHPAQIRTTLARPLQQFVEAQAREIVRSLSSHNVNQAAALVLDNRTGEVLAYVGSLDYFNESQLGRNDGVQALRQPGSTLKPFLYQLALEKRLIRPNTVLADVPTHYAIPGARLYSPSDYTETFQGPVRVRIALANSLNVPAVRVLEKVGVETFLQRLQQLGFQHLDRDPEYYGLGLTLGSGEVSLWELARAYGILARKAEEGRGKHPLSIRVVDDEVLQSNLRSQYSESIVSSSPSSWALITDMLSDRHARAKAFGVDSVLSLPFPVAVKTGTSSNYRDNWTVGFTRDYTVATWMGNFTGEPMQQISGVMGAAQLWHRILLHLYEDREPESFTSPPGMLLRPICALSGLKPTPACPSVVGEYFYPEDLADYEAHPDTFYQIIANSESGEDPQYRLNLPQEYDEWLSKRQPSSLVSSRLKILSPRNGDTFLLPSNHSQGQILELKVSGRSNHPVEWWLNGEKLATQDSSSFFWQLRPGNWTLTVKSGDESDRVNFQVQTGENRPKRRGFSAIE